MPVTKKIINSELLTNKNNNNKVSSNSNEEASLNSVSDDKSYFSTPSFSPNEEPLTPDATVLIFGPASAGKTTLLRRIVSDTFSNIYLPTQLDQRTCSFFKTDGYSSNCVLTFYDVAGQEDYQYYYRSFVDLCSIVFLCFPIGDKSNLETIESNYMPVLTFLSEKRPPLIFLVGTKSDLTNNFTSRDIEEFNKALENLLKNTKYPYFETSSLNGTGHKELMRELINKKDIWPIERTGSTTIPKKKKGKGCFSCCIL